MYQMSSPLTAILSELVAIDSTSSKTNLVLIQVLERRLAALGFSCEIQKYSDDAGVEKANLVARVGSGTPELTLVGHTDCVPFDPTWSEALTLRGRDGRLYGRGSCDTKSFIACALVVAEQTKNRLTKPFQLLFTADEELGCIGAKRLVGYSEKLTYRAIIGEPTSLRPVYANKGYCLAEIYVYGKEGHSAYPATGVSAIFRGARLLTKLQQYEQGLLREDTDSIFVPSFSTLNVGMAVGGTAKNIIPGQMKLTLEWRPLPSQPTEMVLRKVEALIDECRNEDPLFDACIKLLRMDRGFFTAPSADVVTFLSKLSGRAPSAVSFGTEGPQLAALGAVPVVFGPGDIKVAHQTGEFVPEDELYRTAEILRAAVEYFCS